MMAKLGLGRYRKVYARGYQEGRRINSVSIEAEWWYTRLMLVADDYGNFPNDTDLIQAKAAPLRKIGPAAVRRMTEALINADLLVAYSAGGEDYLHMPDFAFHQTSPNGRRTRRYPECPNESGEIQTDPNESGESCCSVVLSPKALVRSPEAEVRSPAGGNEYQPNGKPIDRPEGPSFLAYWHAYPAAKRTGQGKALAAWGECIVEGADPAVIVAKATEYAASPQGRSRFAVTAPRFLADRMFLDPPEAWQDADAAPAARPKLDLADPWGDKVKA